MDILFGIPRTKKSGDECSRGSYLILPMSDQQAIAIEVPGLLQFLQRRQVSIPVDFHCWVQYVSQIVHGVRSWGYLLVGNGE